MARGGGGEGAAALGHRGGASWEEVVVAAALREGEVARQRRWRGAARVLGRVAARAPSTRGWCAPALPSSFYRRGGQPLPLPQVLGAAAKGYLAPQGAPLLGLGFPLLGPAAWAFREGCGQPNWVAAPPLGPCRPFQVRGPQGGPLPEPSRIFRYSAGIFPNFSDTSGNHFPYMNLILRDLG